MLEEVPADNILLKQNFDVVIDDDKLLTMRGDYSTPVTGSYTKLNDKKSLDDGKSGQHGTISLSSLKTLCGSPSLSELSQNTTLDSRASVNTHEYPKKQDNLTVDVMGSRSSPISSNVTENSSMDGEQDGDKMEISYSPVNHLAATEEANMLIELSESGRKSARSNSMVSRSPVQFMEPLESSISSPPAALETATALEDGTDLNSDSTMNNLLLLKNMPSATLSPIVTRQRSSTFAATTFHSKRSLRSDAEGSKNPMAALTWLASMEDDDLDVANSLFELSGQFSLPGSAFKMSPGGSSGNENESEDNEEEEEEEDGYGSVHRYSHHNLELLLPGEEYLKSSKLNHKNVAVPITHNNNIVSRNANGSLAGVGRARSYSMTYLDKSTASAASQMLSSSGAMRGGKNDPLSKALKKFSDKGAMGGEGYIGIYSPEDRKERIQRFLEKRKLRMWTKKVKYDVRKNFADSRVRVKGRFVKKEDEDACNSPN